MAHRQTNYINKHATACRLYSTQSVLGFWRLRASLTSASVLGSPRLLRFLRYHDPSLTIELVVHRLESTTMTWFLFIISSSFAISFACSWFFRWESSWFPVSISNAFSVPLPLFVYTILSWGRFWRHLLPDQCCWSYRRYDYPPSLWSDWLEPFYWARDHFGLFLGVCWFLLAGSGHFTIAIVRTDKIKTKYRTTCTKKNNKLYMR